MDETREQVVVGLGNPLLTDDAVGLVVVARARERLADDHPKVRFAESYAGGFDLLHTLLGARRALLVDAICTGRCPPGTCLELGLDDLPGVRQTRLSGSHGGHLPTLLEAGRRCGYVLPDELSILAVEADDVTSFSERLTPAVEAAVEGLVARIAGTLAAWASEERGQ